MRDQHDQKRIAIVAFNHLTQDEDEAEFDTVGIDRFTPMTGVFNGVEERSYLIDADDLPALRDALARTGQECVLYRDGEFQTYLLSKEDGYEKDTSAEGVKRQWIGRWVEVDATQAARSISYTKFNNRYFTTRK